MPEPSGGGGVAGARPGPTAPATRPTWLLVLSSLTLVYGGLLLVSGLTALRDPAAAVRLPAAETISEEKEKVSRQLTEVGVRIIERHQRAIRTRALASLGVALVLLYAAAATLSRDRHGRKATLTAAWLGILYQVGTLPLVVPIARDYAVAAAPMLAEIVAAETRRAARASGDKPAGGSPTEPRFGDEKSAGSTAEARVAAERASSDPESIARAMQTFFVAVPIGVALLGVLVSLVMLRYFGGGRGRALYGLGPAPPPR